MDEKDAVAAVERLLKGKITESELRALRPFDALENGGRENAGTWTVFSTGHQRMFIVSSEGEAAECTIHPGETFTFTLPEKSRTRR